MIQSDSEKLKVAMEGHTAVVTIDNPPANTWDQDNLGALERVVGQCNEAKDMYALVITGAGDRFFSAGADLNLFADGDKDVARVMADSFGRAFETLAAFRGVSIAAINGFAMGGGLECALACDIRIAERQTWLVGEGWAKRMILCGERVDAETAERISLVEEVVETGEALDRALALALAVGNQSPPAVASCKLLIQQARAGNITGAYAVERSAFVDLFDTRDQKEGVKAFLEKRSPEWING
jgi:enoyl-CoA hydratase/carnithine racemase